MLNFLYQLMYSCENNRLKGLIRFELLGLNLTVALDNILEQFNSNKYELKFCTYDYYKEIYS